MSLTTVEKINTFPTYAIIDALSEIGGTEFRNFLYYLGNIVLSNTLRDFVIGYLDDIDIDPDLPKLVLKTLEAQK